MRIVKKSEFDILLPNIPGSLANICSLINSSKSDILAYALTPMDSAGMLQIVVDNEARVRETFSEKGVHFIESDVLVIEAIYSVKDIGDICGGLAEEKININFSYSGQKGIIVFEVDDVDRTVSILSGRMNV